MKKILVVLLLIVSGSSSFAQEKIMLTKEETINYLNKKLNEAVKHNNSKLAYVKSSSISIKDCSVTYNVLVGSDLDNHPYSTSSSDPYTQEDMEFKFNPMHIKSIEILPGDVGYGSMGRLVVKLISKTGQARSVFKRYKQQSRNYRGAWNGSVFPLLTEYYYTLETTRDATESMATMTFFYLQSDPGNFNKIKKAFEHLQSLCKAEDDPFGE